MMIPPLIDQEYYREVALGSVAEQLFISARDRVFRDFMVRMRPSPSDQILDVELAAPIGKGAIDHAPHILDYRSRAPY